MRVFLITVAAACGGAAPAAPSVNAPPVAVKAAAPQKNVAAIDALAALAEPSKFPTSFAIPGLASLQLDGAAIQAPPARPEIAGIIVDEQTQMVRLAVHSNGLAFAIWTERARLLAIAKHDQNVTETFGAWNPNADAPFAEIRRGAHVRVLKHRDARTQIRYLGSLELDGWVPDTALVDRTMEEHVQFGRMPTGLPTLMATPGTVIRAEPKWAADEIAVMANGYFLDTIKDVDDAWAEVGYEDGDIRVRGYASRQDPPGRVHKPHESDTPPQPIQPNATVVPGTCLYDVVRGEPIGFVVEMRPAELSSARSPGWYTLAFDTEWGAITFAATGTSEHDLATCGPPVVSPAPAAPPVP